MCFFSEEDVHCYHWLTVNSADDLKSTYSDTVNWGYLGHFLLFAASLPSNRHHRSCGDRLEGMGENYQVCSVQYCVQQLCTVRCTHI